MNDIKNLNKMKYIKKSFKPLFNYNYRKCIEVIVYILKNYPIYLQESISLASDNQDLYIVDDGIYSGSSSIFFRLVFEYFKSQNLFGYDIMDLVDVTNPFKKGANNKELTSRARIILMYIYNESQKKDGGNTRLDQIFKYFNNIYSLQEICDTIYSLFSRNSAWRRPIFFSDRPLKEHEEKQDLIDQQKIYLNEGSKEPKNFTKFEICKAGIEYIDFVISHFEFFSCRKSETSKNGFLPPLFSKESLVYYNGEKKYGFEITCQQVLVAVEECCKKLKEFNNIVMTKKKINLAKYLEEPIIKRTERKKPQLHEERVIFCHIFYLESYRDYIVNNYFKDSSNDFRADMNKRIVNIIEEYIRLYNNYIISKKRITIINKLVEKITIIATANYFDFDTKIDYNRN